MSGVEAFIETWPEAIRPLTRRLRDIALAAAPDVTEHIKWNAPSFCVEGDDRITLGLERSGAVRVVLHRGAKAKDAAGFAFTDPDRLARWAAPDRGVLVFKDAAALEAVEGPFGDLCERWLAATR
ncbi:DUF1801 domain-containing protein [Brevundimonas sp. Leaf363]|uniref:DUF1801 domain-containing protein n=1 Tax=Brevundimonas sp. Leaf363 TaxID=1736353 RepID=UPI000B26309A|nr:DUF1801 domain-containing protein [Brevundimonas sp. Leaf363]